MIERVIFGWTCDVPLCPPICRVRVAPTGTKGSGAKRLNRLPLIAPHRRLKSDRTGFELRRLQTECRDAVARLEHPNIEGSVHARTRLIYPQCPFAVNHLGSGRE